MLIKKKKLKEIRFHIHGIFNLNVYFFQIINFIISLFILNVFVQFVLMTPFLYFTSKHFSFHFFGINNNNTEVTYNTNSINVLEVK